jgi:catechol 2,3-dioxygenase-like lactoylglutathione lyase family enzyme
MDRELSRGAQFCEWESSTSHGNVSTYGSTRRLMANAFGTDVLIQAKDAMKAAKFYVKELGFEITDKKPNMISLHGKDINFFIERGPALGPVFEVTVKSVKEAKARLKKKGCRVVKDEPDFPRCYVKDPYGLIYNLTE